MKRWIVVGTVLLVAAVALFLLRRNQAHADQATGSVRVTRGNVVQQALAIGSVVPEQEISVKSKVPGLVSRLHVAVGDQVEAGEPLLDIRPDPTPLERAEAERALELARVAEEGAAQDMERAEGLYAKGLVSDKERDDARRARESARLRADLEREKLELLKEGRARVAGAEVSNQVVAPTSGTILSIDAHPGDPVVPLTSYQEGTVLMAMADMSELIFKGTVDEVDVGRLEVGQTVGFTVGALPNAEVKGILRRISPKARKEESTTLFDVEARIVPDAGVVLRAGYSANARITFARADSVLTIPERLLRYENGTAHVQVQRKGAKKGVGEDMTIETGLSDGLNVEVKSGLEEGDELLEPPKSPLAEKK